MKKATCLHNGNIKGITHPSAHYLEVGKEYYVVSFDDSRIVVLLDTGEQLYWRERFGDIYESDEPLNRIKSISELFEDKVKLLQNVHDERDLTQGGEHQQVV